MGVMTGGSQLGVTTGVTTREVPTGGHVGVLTGGSRPRGHHWGFDPEYASIYTRILIALECGHNHMAVPGE